MNDENFCENPYDYSEWVVRSTTTDCLKVYGYNELAACVMRDGFDYDFIKECINVVEVTAKMKKDVSMLDRLAQAGLLGA